MDAYMNPDFAINIKRRAIVRAVLVVVLVFLLVSTMYNALGAELTVAVPKNVTAVTLQRTGELLHQLDMTLTEPEDVHSFCSYFSQIGKLHQAHLSDRMWTSGPPYVITFHTADGLDMTYTIHSTQDGVLKLEDSSWFAFPGYSALTDLIQTYPSAQ